MKSSHMAAVSAAVAAASTLVAPLSHGQTAGSTIPPYPIGVLSAYPSVVQTGTKPTLTWDILFPSVVSDVAEIKPPGTIKITKKNVYVSVQPIGTDITACDASQGINPLNADARFSLNGSAYQQLFYGTQSDVEPAYSLYIKKQGVGDTLDFAGRYVKKSGTWSSLYTTLSTNFQVIALVNGATPPTALPMSNKLANYLKPYIDSTGKVKIGPMSVLILMELGETDRNMPCFDYQDLVLLVTLSTKHPNNGHGNNLDGVDSSNPGGGSGGPNGMIDPSGGVDDEMR